MSKGWEEDVDGRELVKSFSDSFLSEFGILIYAKYVLITFKSVSFLGSNLSSVSTIGSKGFFLSDTSPLDSTSLDPLLLNYIFS